MKNGIKKGLESNKFSENASDLVKDVGKFTTNVSNKAKVVINNTKESIINGIDENGDGQIDIEDIIIKGLRVPGIRINRNDFLQNELYKNYSQDVIGDAIANNPAHAKIPSEEIDKIAEEVIKFERNTMLIC